MASDFSEFMRDNKYRYVACGKREAINFLIARAALRGEVSDLLEEDELDLDFLLNIKEKAYNDTKPLWQEVGIVMAQKRGKPSGQHYMWI